MEVLLDVLRIQPLLLQHVRRYNEIILKSIKINVITTQYALSTLFNEFLSFLCKAPPVIVPVGANAMAVNVEDNVLFQFKIIKAYPPVVRDNITWSLSTSNGPRTLGCENTTK